jgi:colanic acid/amylovoran biosynthesis glycosyltransferase
LIAESKNMKFIKKLIVGLAIFCVPHINAQEFRSLHIMFVVDYFPAPGQTFILNIITGLIDNGHTVSIFAFHKNDTMGQLVQPNVEKYSLMDRVIYEEFPGQMPSCDIVFCQSATLGKAMLEINTCAEWIKQRKMVVALRGHDITNNEVKDDPSIYQKLFNEADLFLPVCHYFKNIAIALGCHPDKVMVHHSAIDCSLFFFRKKKRRKHEKTHIVSVCRLVEKKGLDIAIQAIAKLVKKYKNVHFTIVGRGRLRDSLECLVKKLNIADRVTFFGWATQDQIVKILDKSHIFLLPSITASNGDEEGIANSLKEAMSMGLIAIGTVHAGTPELIEDGVSGFLVPEKSSKELTKKIKYVIDHPERWKSIGRAARKKVEDEFETKKSIKELEQIFYQLIEQS